MIAVVVIDDHRVFAQAIGARLAAEEDISVLAIAASLREAREMVGEQHVDVMLVDAMPEQTHDRAIIAAVGAEAIVVVSACEETRVAVAALRAGARGYVLKDCRFEELLGAVRGAAHRETWVTPRVLTGVLTELIDDDAGRADVRGRISSLTKREREVLQRLVDGLDRAEIARQSYMSLSTVRTHTHHIFRKLGAHSTVEAVSIALRAGFVPRALEN